MVLVALIITIFQSVHVNTFLNVKNQSEISKKKLKRYPESTPSTRLSIKKEPMMIRGM